MGEDTPERRKQFTATIPWGRFSTPQDIANAALFLLPDEADMVTGSVLAVDGGRSASEGALVRGPDRSTPAAEATFLPVLGSKLPLRPETRRRPDQFAQQSDFLAAHHGAVGLEARAAPA